MEETGEIMLFGVRVVVDALRKSVSLNDLSQYVYRRDSVKVDDGSGRQMEDVVPSACSGGYGSADEAVAHPSSGSRGERKRGVPWTEEEHKLFLLGLKRVGKGDWRGISRNFVKTRTPTQVASHAQKYFLRRVNVNRRRRRTSLFDITTDSLSPTSMEEDQSFDRGTRKNGFDSCILAPSPPEMSVMSNQSIASKSVISYGPMEASTNFQGHRSEPSKLTITAGSRACATPSLDLNLDMSLTTSVVEPSSLSLNLSLSSGRTGSSSSKSPFQGIRSYNDGKSIISVA